MAVKIDEDELIECWTLVGEELGQVAGKRGATRLGFLFSTPFSGVYDVADGPPGWVVDTLSEAVSTTYRK